MGVWNIGTRTQYLHVGWVSVYRPSPSQEPKTRKMHTIRYDRSTGRNGAKMKEDFVIQAFDFVRTRDVNVVDLVNGGLDLWWLL